MARSSTFTQETIVKAIKRYKREFGAVPKMKDLGSERPPGYPSAQTLRARFGSFANAIEAAGFKRPTRGRPSVAA